MSYKKCEAYPGCTYTSCECHLSSLYKKHSIGEHSSVAEELLTNVSAIKLQCEAAEESVKEGCFNLVEALKNYKVTTEQYVQYLSDKTDNTSVRSFRLRKRHTLRTHNGISETMNQIVNHRDYIGVDKFIAHGIETYNRYNNSYGKDVYEAEVCEHINGKWVKLSKTEVAKLINLSIKKFDLVDNKIIAIYE